MTMVYIIMKKDYNLNEVWPDSVIKTEKEAKKEVENYNNAMNEDKGGDRIAWYVKMPLEDKGIWTTVKEYNKQVEAE